MKVWNKFNGRNLTLATTALATLTLVGGCCTRGTGGTASYSQQEAQPAATGQTTSTQTTSTDNMVVPLYQESVNVGKREVDAGQVRLKKIVKTETVNVPVELRHEEVVIDRDKNATGTAQNQALGERFQEGETTIQLKQEVPVVEKTTTSAGQIVVQKRFSAQQTNIQAEVRKEDIDIARTGDTGNVIIGQNVHASVNASGAAESPGGQTSAEVSSSGPITDISMLTSGADVSRLANRPVECSGLKVRRIISDKVVVLGGDNGQDVYAMTQGRPNIAEGDTVTVSGTVKSTSDLTGDAAQALSSQRCYIDASKIEAAK
jgi:uncharacterized protein (TIGR02271 family)